MARDQELGKYFWRGGERIEVEKEDEVFTIIARNEAELKRVKALPGVSEVKQVQNRVFKAKASPDQRDKAMESIRSEEIGGVCHHAYRHKSGPGTRYYITDKIVVRFKQGLPRKTIEGILLKVGVRVLKNYSGTPNTLLIQVTRDAGMNPIKVANSLAEYDEVEYAEPNLVNRFQSSYTPQDTLFYRQWHLRSWDGISVIAGADVSATEAWDITRGNHDVVVAVIDDGFDLSHPDFSVTGKVVHPKDYVDGDSNPFPVTSAGDYHGTPCAGVALAEENGEGVVGIAPGCAFMPVRFPLSADDDFLWDIFDFVGNRADVISCSWGPPPVYSPLGSLLTDKFHELATSGGARKKGCVIVFAAGNYNAPLNDPNNTHFVWYHPNYGLVVTQEPILNGYTTHPDVVAVSASTSQNRKAAYSNWGEEISVCAPSNNFHPLDRQVNVPGLGIWTTDNEQFGGGFTDGSRFTGDFGGTSSAAPLVAGVAALIISANPELSASQVKEILESTADKIVDPNPDPVLGLNKGDYDNNEHSEWFGYGRVNAHAAVRRADEMIENVIPSLDVEANANGNLPATGSTQLFKVTIGADLSVTLDGPENEDFDLYVKHGGAPTVDSYDARGYSPSANERVSLPAQPGDYYIMVRSYHGSGDFQLKVELT